MLTLIRFIRLIRGREEVLLRLEVLVFVGGIEAGAGFLWVEDDVTHDEGTGVLLLEVAEKLEKGTLLGTGAGVLGIAGGVEAAFVTDAEGVGVMTGAVGANS